MYITRDIFQLKFGTFRDAKTLIDEHIQLLDDLAASGDVPTPPDVRVLSDFAGDSYRLI